MERKRDEEMKGKEKREETGKIEDLTQLIGL